MRGFIPFLTYKMTNNELPFKSFLFKLSLFQSFWVLCTVGINAEFENQKQTSNINLLIIFLVFLTIIITIKVFLLIVVFPPAFFELFRKSIFAFKTLTSIL